VLRDFASLYEWVNLFITMVSKPCNKSNVSNSNLGEKPTPTKESSKFTRLGYQPQPLKEGRLLRDFV